MTDSQQQDPLAALEELLEDSKSGGGKQDAKAAEEKQAADEKVIEDQKKQEIVDMEKAQQGKDAEAIRSHIDGLKTISDTPQEQARLDQVEKNKQKEEKKESDQEEYQIRQLDHSKI